MVTVLYSLRQNIVFKNQGYLFDEETYLGKKTNIRKRPLTSTPTGSQDDLDGIGSSVKKPRIMKILKNLSKFKFGLNCTANAEVTIDEQEETNARAVWRYSR